MKIGYLGAGSWGFCLASLLAKKGYTVALWDKNRELIDQLTQKREHPAYSGVMAPDSLQFTTSLEAILEDPDFLIESVTSAGVRSVFEEIRERGIPVCPIVMTSKGIEQDTGFILPDVVAEVLGEPARHHIGILSGPSFAEDVIHGLPTSVVGSGYTRIVRDSVCHLFTTPYFRVYPNSDIVGVAYGGALKNIIAIACGIAEGLGYGWSSRAALITRGLHEMRKLASKRGAAVETLNGLSGMGDLCLTCSTSMSRNFRFGTYLAKGEGPEAAKKHVGMVVEGAYTARSALQLSRQYLIPMPITELVYAIIYEGIAPQEAVNKLMEREIKEEHL